MFFVYLAAGFLTPIILTVLAVTCRQCYFRCLKWNSRRRRAVLLDELGKLGVYYWSDELPSNDTCPICREIFSHGDALRILPCVHSYHVLCIDNWIDGGNLFCPLCKHGIIPRAERYLPQDFIDGSGEYNNENNPLLAS